MGRSLSIDLPNLKDFAIMRNLKHTSGIDYVCFVSRTTFLNANTSGNAFSRSLMTTWFLCLFLKQETRKTSSTQVAKA